MLCILLSSKYTQTPNAKVTCRKRETQNCHYFDEDSGGMPIITLQVMPDSSIAEIVSYDGLCPDTRQNDTVDEDMTQNDVVDDAAETAGVHFLTEKTEPDIEQNNDKDLQSGNTNGRPDLLEYTTRSDGSVSCNLCGKIVASRPHWYRHKYRAHALHPLNPAPLFQCEQCLIYFKSRKGYIGHIASKHSETLQDVSPVLTNAQAEALARENESKTKSQPILTEATKTEPSLPDPSQTEVKKEPDPELSIPKSIVPTYQNIINHRQTATKTTENTRKTRSTSKEHVNDKDSEEKRSREEKLVADIIARVRKECEAQGSGGPARRGYSRKPALHT